LSIFEISAISSGSAVLILFLLLAIRADLRKYALPRRMRLQLLRNASQFAWTFSLTLLPLLEFTMPIWTALRAARGRNHRRGRALEPARGKQAR
jgi:hypothetical protein